MAVPELPKNHNRRREEADEEYRVWNFNPVMSVIFILGAALLGWTVSLIPDISSIKVTSGFSTGILAAIFLLTYANVSGSRSALVIRSTAWSGLTVSTLIMILMSIFCTKTEYFFIVSAFIALIFLAVAYSVARARQ